MTEAELAQLALLWAADHVSVWTPAAIMLLAGYVLAALHLVAWLVGVE